MDDNFGVAVRLENRAAMLELAAPVGGIGEIAVVAERHFALVAIDHDGLRVEKSFIARGGITRVADGSGAGKFVQNVGCENFFDFAHGAVGVEFVAVAGKTHSDTSSHHSGNLDENTFAETKTMTPEKKKTATCFAHRLCRKIRSALRSPHRLIRTSPMKCDQ